MNTNSSQARSVMVGLIMVVVVWFTSLISVPLTRSEGLKNFEIEMLLLVRSCFGAIASLIIARGVIRTPHRKTLLTTVLLAFSSLSFYHAIKIWNVNPVMVVMTATPLINVIVAFWEGKRISRMVLVSMFMLIFGMTFALQLWKQTINLEGLLFAGFATISSGFILELWFRDKDSTSQEKCFWSCFVLAIITLGIICARAHSGSGPQASSHALALLALFGFVSGVIYFPAYLVASQKLPPTIGGVLMQGQTPMTIVGAYLMLGEKLNPTQWFGVICALAGTMLLSWWVAKTKSSTEQQG